MTKIFSTNPAHNYETIGEVEASTDAEIQQAVKFANKAKVAWRGLGVEKRIEYLKPILAELRESADEIAQLMTKEMGKPISQSESEVEEYTDEFEWHLDNVAKALEPVVTHETSELKTYMTY